MNDGDSANGSVAPPCLTLLGRDAKEHKLKGTYELALQRTVEWHEGDATAFATN